MATSSRILFIINPNAGKRKTKRLIQQLDFLKDNVIYRLTEYPKHSIEIIQKELNRFDVFVAVGGDGTVNEVASALVNTDKKLAVYPAGSGNGFAREFGFTKNLKHLMQAIEIGETRKTDVNRINGLLSIHITGVGYDAAVAHDFTKLKGRGFWNYLISTVRVIFDYHSVQASIQLEKGTIAGRFFIIDIANSAQYGYGAKMAPMADPTDGQFDLVLVKPLYWLEFPYFAFKLFTGQLKNSRKIQYIPCQSPVTIVTSEKNFHIDGEAVQLISPLQIEVQRGVLNVINTGKVKKAISSLLFL
ncbi:diacylglycerol kinase family protein [uncultured Sunxiuqinia sp.]|uniref:diacylglycerol/lipid kinase family protein n=1 Tax=uncultured Sunxiuqinia sp. TaxID=1573825 RepID=UPI002AA63CAA|nr:diacylglycerol kinase family protein [uncultured Sunxiuqinia sp.]